MSDLEEILNQTDLRAQLRHQKEILEVGFLDDCVFAYNGGLFDLTPEFLAGVYLRSKNKNQFWIIDRNKNPIMINDAAAFVEQAVNIYEQAIEKYCGQCNDLRRKRSVTSIITL